MKHLTTVAVQFQDNKRMKVPISQEVYQIAMGTDKPLVVSGYTATGECAFSFFSGKKRQHKSSTRYRWFGERWTYISDNDFNYWTDTAKITIDDDGYINFHRQKPYEREKKIAYITLDINDIVDTNILNIQL